MWHYQFSSVRCVCPLPVGRATLRLLVRSNGARCADSLGFRRVSTSSESTGRLARQPVVSGRLRTWLRFRLTIPFDFFFYSLVGVLFP